MILHKDKINFQSIIRGASRYFNLSPAIIEKDYYVSLILKELVKEVPGIVFKGGTSLSKCYKIIDRFSEDIDITLDDDNQSNFQRKNLKNKIIEICRNLDLNIDNINDIKSRRDYNCYKINYMSVYYSSELNPRLLIETVFIIKSYPIEIKEASSLIYDFVKSIGNYEIINKYELDPFFINVQTIERTFIDKVFAICDYMISFQIERHSRHIYDLYKLLFNITLDSQLKELVKEVRENRKTNRNCFSAQDGININKLLQEIIDTEVYKKDYIKSTEKLIRKQISYNEAINSLNKIIDSKIFE